MNFSFSEDQLAFRDAVRDLLRGQCTVDGVRDAWTNETGRVKGLWDQLAEQGVTTISLPEELGGLGLNDLDTILILEEAGRAGAPEPIVEVVSVVLPLIGDAVAAGSEVARRLAQEIVDGALVLPVLDGSGLALYADQAQYLIVEREGRILAVPASALQLSKEISVDRSRRLFKFEFDASAAEEILAGDAAASVLARAKDRGALGAAAFLVGLGDTMVKLGVEYAKTRKQFNTPIGAFQAIQHRLVNGWMAVEFARPMVYRAAYSLSINDPESALHVSMAKIYASDGAHRAGREVLQCHGAIGYTTEYELHLFMKRAWALAGTWGDKRSHEVRVESILLD